MPGRDESRTSNPFLKTLDAAFIVGEAQEESIARLEYLRDHGGGWCRLTGPRGIGKTLLLEELQRRAIQYGEACTTLEFGTMTATDWLPLVADAWNLPVDRAASAMEIRRAMQEHMLGMAAMKRTMWLLVDQVDEVSSELLTGIRWLCGCARRCELVLTVVIAGREEGESTLPREDANLYLELWPWSAADCGRYLDTNCRRAGLPNAFTADAVDALEERTSGIPGRVAKLAEWTFLAAETESEAEIGANLVHVVADELSPGTPRSTTYELSAAYGAW